MKNSWISFSLLEEIDWLAIVSNFLWENLILEKRDVFFSICCPCFSFSIVYFKLSLPLIFKWWVFMLFSYFTWIFKKEESSLLKQFWNFFRNCLGKSWNSGMWSSFKSSWEKYKNYWSKNTKIFSSAFSKLFKVFLNTCSSDISSPMRMGRGEFIIMWQSCGKK